MLFPLLPLFAFAQSSEPSPQCQHACNVEYEERVEQCEKAQAQDREACYQQAVLYVVPLAGVIVSVDLLFFKNRFWERLAANVGIVLLFAAFYSRFAKHG